MSRYLILLGLTLALEVTLALLLAPAGRRHRLLCDAMLLNLLSHPLAVLATVHAGLPFAVVELGVVALEGLGYCVVSGLSSRRALLLTLACNGATIALSLLMSSGTYLD